MAKTSDKTEWFPEMFGDAAVYRIEHAKRELWDNLRTLLPNNSILKQPGARVAFERADVKAESSTTEEAQATPVNWVFFTPFSEARESAIQASIEALKASTHWKTTFDAVGLPYSAEITTALSSNDSTHKQFDNLLKTFSQIPITGFVSAILTKHYFGSKEKPAVYIGTAAKDVDQNYYFEGESLDASLNKVDKLEKKVQSANKVGNFTARSNGNKSSFPTKIKALFDLYTTVLIEPSGRTSDYVSIALPLFTHNGRLKNCITSPAGTFIGWLRVDYEAKTANRNRKTAPHLSLLKNNKKALKALIAALLPIADAFATRLIDDLVAEQLMAEDTKEPLPFLQRHLHKMSGWSVCNPEPTFVKPQDDLPFAFHEGRKDRLTVWLTGDCFSGFKDPITLYPKATTALPLETDRSARINFGGHVAYRLRAIVSQLESLHYKEHADEMRKYRQMLELLQKPLQNLSGALSTMQSESQELRAILFEPEDALFASHAAISSFFKEGAKFPLDEDWTNEFRIKHSPSQYEEREARLLLACLICAIFGELDKLKKLAHHEVAIAKAASIAAGKAASPATKLIAKDIAWVLAKEDMACISDFILNAEAAALKEAITRIKSALFSPFKAMSNEWNPIAFLLLIRNEIFKGCKHEGELKKSNRLQLYDSPITCAAALAFLRDITLALRDPDFEGKAQRNPKSLRFRDSGGEKILSLNFSTAISNNRGGLDINHLREILSMLAQRAPREWRVENDHFGDSTRPFVFLVNKILGLGEKTKFGWEIEIPQSRELFVCAQYADGNKVTFSFGITPNGKGIYLKWKRQKDQKLNAKGSKS